MPIFGHSFDGFADSMTVWVELGGERHERTFTFNSDLADLKVAQSFMRHAEMLQERLGDGADVQRAVMVDQCLALERLFPHLKDRLPA
jgi:hypothetical protein